MAFFYPSDLAKAFGEQPHLDDGCDRAHRFYMPLILVLACSVLGLKQFAGDPIHCYTGSNLNPSQIDYVKNYCWTASTYQILDTDYDTFRLPQGTDHLLEDVRREPKDSILLGKKVYVSYYQWVPVLLAIQALLFHFPYLIWYTFVVRGAIHLPHLMNGAYLLAKVQSNPIARRTALDDAAYILDAHFRDNAGDTESATPDWRQRLRGAGHFALFVIVKLCYIGNVVFQLFCIHSFLQLNILAYSADVVRTLFFGHTWLTSARFPIRTLCEFRGLPQIHGYLLPHTCHCVLPINLYNDKLFAGLVFLMTFMLAASCLNLVLWLFLVFGATRRSLIRCLVAERNGDSVKRFVDHYLRTDGLFILHLIDQNVGRNTAKEIVNALYRKYRNVTDSDCPSAYESCPRDDTVFEAADLRSVLRCFSCDRPWDERDEGRPCEKCKNILKSQA